MEARRDILHAAVLASALVTLAPAVRAEDVPKIVVPQPKLRPSHPVPGPEHEVVYYRKPPAYRSLDVRLAPETVGHGDDLTWSVGGDAVLAGRFGWGRGTAHWGFWPELGYAGHFEDDPRHAGLLQVGIGRQSEAYQAGLLLGGTVPVQDDGNGLGARATAVFELWRGGIGLTAGYDAFPGRDYAQAFRFGVSVGILHVIRPDGGKL